MSDYLDKLVQEGMSVLGSRVPSGHRFIHDAVDSLLFHKWVLNCIGFLAQDAPEHVAQIKLVHKPDIALHHQAVQIFGILSSAVEVIRAQRDSLSDRSVAEKFSPQSLRLANDSRKSPFISYAREDSKTARRLYDDLTGARAEPWLDSQKLLGGQDWEAAIRRAVRESTHFLALISENSVNKRGYVQKELREALEILDEFPPDQVFVIPIRLDNSSPNHERLRRLHWIDLFPDYDEGFSRIIASMGISAISGKTRPPAMSEQHPKLRGDVPQEVIARIRARVERDFPDDFSTQQYVINNETQAWRQLETFSAPGVPDDVVQNILRHATEQFPDDFSTRLYVANNEVNAWMELQLLNESEIPTGTLEKIIAKAARQFPYDFGTRLYVIRNEITAWKQLNQ